MSRVLLVLVLVAGCPGTEPPPPEPHRITFTTTSDGEPLAEVAISLGSRAVGSTDDSGQLVVNQPGFEGDVLPVRAQCPAGFRPAQGAASIILRNFQALTEETAERGLVVALRCPPAERAAAVVVRAPDRADLPVRFHGREVARTDEFGVAHVELRLAAHSRFTLELDTRAHPLLRPQNPTKTFFLRDADEVFVMDQPFEERIEPQPQPQPRQRRRRRRRRVRQPTPRLPERLGEKS